MSKEFNQNCDCEIQPCLLHQTEIKEENKIIEDQEAKIIDIQGINEDLIHVSIIDEYRVIYTGALEKDEIQ